MKRALVVATLVACAVMLAPVRAAVPEHPPDLVQLAKEYREWRRHGAGEVPNYTAQVESEKTELAAFRHRLEALDTSAWPVHNRVDYLVLRAEMDDLDFDLRV